MLNIFTSTSLNDVYCYAEQVPNTFDGNLFVNSPIEEATLHVPASSINDYKSTAPWSSFMNIVALTDDELSGIKQTMNGVMPIDDEAVYNLSGQRVNHDAKGIIIKNGRKYIAK